MQNIFGDLVPYFFDMSSASGYRGAKDVQECGPRFLAWHIPNVACTGVSISIVSISSMLCRVRILHVSVFMSCRGHPVYRSKGPCDVFDPWVRWERGQVGI